MAVKGDRNPNLLIEYCVLIFHLHRVALDRIKQGETTVIVGAGREQMLDKYDT